MQIIPVIDLQDGHAVHARKGQREHYLPINSPLCPSSEPRVVLDSFLALYPFSTIYLADLNSITLNGQQDALIAGLITSYPYISFWVDRGYREDNFTFSGQSNFVPVIGSESLSNNQFEHLPQGPEAFVLSLDFMDSTCLGPKELFCQSELWPKNIILMSLAKVGSSSGPDLMKLNLYKNRYPDFNFIAAGGIQDQIDLEQLQNSGINQALVASALHHQIISHEVIRSLSKEKKNKE